MLAEMSPSELGEWLAEYSISPWGEWRADFAAAQTTAMLGNIHRDPSKQRTPFVPRDFMYENLADLANKQARDQKLSDELRATLLAMSRTRDNGTK